MHLNRRCSVDRHWLAWAGTVRGRRAGWMAEMIMGRIYRSKGIIRPRSRGGQIFPRACFGNIADRSDELGDGVP